MEAMSLLLWPTFPNSTASIISSDSRRRHLLQLVSNLLSPHKKLTATGASLEAYFFEHVDQFHCAAVLRTIFALLARVHQAWLDSEINVRDQSISLE